MKILFLLLMVYGTQSVFSQEYYQINDKVFDKEKFEEEIQKLKIEFQQNSQDSIDVVFDYKILNSFFRNDSLINDVEIVKAINPKKNLFKEKIFSFKDEQLPKFELKDLNDNTVYSESLKGKITFINLWFISCPPCIKEIPQLASLKKKYGDKINFVAITFDSSYKVKAFLDKHKEFDYTHLIDAREYLHDTLGNKSFPKNLILDKGGKVVHIDYGIPSKTEKDKSHSMTKRIENIIDSLL